MQTLPPEVCPPFSSCADLFSTSNIDEIPGNLHSAVTPFFFRSQFMLPILSEEKQLWQVTLLEVKFRILLLRFYQSLSNSRLKLAAILFIESIWERLRYVQELALSNNVVHLSVA